MSLSAEALFAAQMRHARYYLDRLKQANAKYNQGGAIGRAGLAQYEGDYAQIRQAYERLADVALAGSRDLHREAADLCLAMFTEGRQLLHQHQLEPEFLDWINSAISVAEQHAEDDQRLQLYHWRCNALYQYGHWQASIDAVDALLAQVPPGSERMAGALSQKATNLMRLGQLDEAENVANQALVLINTLGDRYWRGQALTTLALVYERRSDHQQAEALTAQALAIWREIGERRAEANAIDNLGMIAWRQGDVDRARNYWDQALRLDMLLGYRSGIAGRIINLGAAAYLQGDYPASLSYFEQAAALNRKLGRRHSVAISLSNAGEVAGLMGNVSDAIRYCEEAQHIAQDIGSMDIWAEASRNLSGLYLKRGSVIQAWVVLQETAAVWDQITASFRLKLLLAWAEVVLHQGEASRAAWIAGAVGAEPGAQDAEIRHLLEGLWQRLLDGPGVDDLQAARELGAAQGADVLAAVLRAGD